MWRRYALVGVVMSTLALGTIPAGAASWPQSGHDGRRSNFNAVESTIGVENVTGLVRAWRIRSDAGLRGVWDPTVTPNPMVARGALITQVSMCSGADCATTTTRLLAADLRTGAVRWERKGLTDLAWSGAVVDGVLVSGSYAQVTGFDLGSQRIVWTMTDSACSSPHYVASNGMIYTTRDGTQCRIDPITGEAETLTVDHVEETWGISAEGDLLALGAFDGMRGSAYDLATGDRRWTSFVGNPVWTSIAGSVVVLTVEGSGWMGLDRETGSLVWSAPVGPTHPEGAQPALGGGAAYLVTETGRVRSIDVGDGAVRWGARLPVHHSASETRPEAPVLANGVLYAVLNDADPSVFAIDATTGQVIDEIPTRGGRIWGVEVVDGTVLVTTNDRTVAWRLPTS